MPETVDKRLGAVRFVLVSPLQSGNVGSIARAMKNMGVDDLAVVAPRALDMDRARWMAPGATDVLDRAQYCRSVAEAVAGCRKVYATTARDRHNRWPAFEPAGFAGDALAVTAGGERIAVLFGPEDAGLGNEALVHAHALIHIPTDVHASLNVSQAALLIAAALFGEARAEGLVARAPGQGPRGGTQRGAAPGATREATVAPLGTLEPLVKEWMSSLELGTYLKGHETVLVEGTLRRILQRAGLDEQEITVLRGMFRKMRWKMGEDGRR